MARTSTNLVNQAFNLFRIQKLVNQVRPETSFLRPFITVAREPGSGGAPIAKAVAEKLGFEFVDKQILEAISNLLRNAQQLLRKLTRKVEIGSKTLFILY